ncbi:MAG: Spy/CpxP family protein refolding chaperone [Xanthobacteraceae bacterium]
MRRIGAYVLIGALAAVIFAPPPSAAFGPRSGPLHIGLPLQLLPHSSRFAPRSGHRRRIALHPPVRKGVALFDKAEPGGAEPAQGLSSALLYPGLALPALYDEIFWPTSSSEWPFDYEAIFRTAFAKSRADQDAQACQQPDRATAIVERIKSEIRPSAAQLRLLQELGSALGMASGYLTKSCPNAIPAQPVARLQLMQSQIEVLTMALDIVRPPLQQFEQSLNDSQRAQFAARRSASTARPDYAASPTATDWSIEQIDQSVQPSDNQRDALADLKQAFAAAAGDLDAHCPFAWPRSTPLARLESTEAHLDASWRAVLSIQVALADFESRLSDQQRVRFDAMDLAAAR